jgi:hypothetical protein
MAVDRAAVIPAAVCGFSEAIPAAAAVEAAAVSGVVDRAVVPTTQAGAAVNLAAAGLPAISINEETISIYQGYDNNCPSLVFYF